MSMLYMVWARVGVKDRFWVRIGVKVRVIEHCKTSSLGTSTILLGM